ncbi:ABC transporter ATP-binding protein [Candidatus Gracilibacteria bacterium]|nr:ABC transporter ATP-binding protein [Candidatus Gracilibacteria bacterium]
MNYTLSHYTKQESLWTSSKMLLGYLGKDRYKMIWAILIVLFNSAVAIVTPYLIGKATDDYIVNNNLAGLTSIIFSLIVLYLASLSTSYFQMTLMGGVAQRMLYRLRQSIFNKLQSLPVAFFQANKAGDLTSRINNDTDKLNQFLSESIMRFLGNIFVIVGIGIFVLTIQLQLGLVMLASTLIIFILSKIIEPMVSKANKVGAAATGNLSGQIQESLSNFKVIVAFNKRQYFTDKLAEFNQDNYKGTIKASIANSIYKPIYDSAGNIANALILLYGLYLISQGTITIGILIAFLSFAQKFYGPLQIMGTIIGNIQMAMASWQRITTILNLENDLVIVPTQANSTRTHQLMQFDDVSFGYTAEKLVLKNISLSLLSGMTYAIVGPTGGGKSTLASLMSRLYDPTSGTIYFKGQDIRSYPPEVLTASIGFILQDPLLFTGTIGENIRYGNLTLQNCDDEIVSKYITDAGMAAFLEKFPEGLATVVSSENITLGQKQLIAFMRVILRKPELLILDEATANIDTVTEQLLNKLIELLPKSTTKVIIAHRLNTIKAADTIMFINNGQIEEAMDFDHALHLLDHAKRVS